MNLTIDNKTKQEAFVAIFQLLKNWSSHIIMNFEPSKLYIQSMDKSHVCLADITIHHSWFSTYQCISTNKISVDTTHFAILMNYGLKHGTIELIYDDSDKLFVNFLNNDNNLNIDNVKGKKKDNKTTYEHFFELSLIDADEDGLEIPTVDYDVEFIIDSKKFIDVLSELNTFGQDIYINCTEDLVELNSSGDAAKLKVNIPTSDLDEFSIIEGGKTTVSFSLMHLYKMCCSLKLGENINISISAEYPMELKYDLGDSSSVSFYIAPKIEG
jgi:proliferating cell nuclear antigen